MSKARALGPILVAVCAVLPVRCGSAAVAGTTTPLEVIFRLTTLDYQPIAGEPVRLVLGARDDWQDAAAGDRFVTDDAGAHRYRTAATIERTARKLPSNFLDSLLSRPKTVDHLRIAAELQYMTHQWLYVVQAFRFPNGDTLQDGVSIYTRDAQGRFTIAAEGGQAGWKIADLGGLLLTDPGHSAWNVALTPTGGAPGGWTLDLAFKRSPPPVRR